MNILVTQQNDKNREIFFPEQCIEKLSSSGNVRFNESDTALTESQLIEISGDVDVLLTHWSCPYITDRVLQHATDLRLIAHAAGSVAYIASESVYEKGIKVCSSNEIMARFVAEGVLAYMLSGLRLIPWHDQNMKVKGGWNRRVCDVRSLYGMKIGLVGLGTVGRFLIEILQPFNVKIKIYDPYLSQDNLKGYHNLQLDTLHSVLMWGDIISIHASLTPETFHMIDAEKLGIIRDNALFINTARGKIVDENALVRELDSGRISAVLDVFEKEPLDISSDLRLMDNVILIPHMAGSSAKEQMTYAMIEEIARFKEGKPLKYEVPYEKFKLMTRNVELEAERV